MKEVMLDEKGIILRCSHCQARNRLSYGHLDQPARCSKCKEALPAVDFPVELTSDAAFAALVNQSSLPVFVDCWAPWCGPCKMVAPELIRLAGQTKNECLIAKLNVDALPGTAGLYKIASIPTFLLFQNGTEIARLSGARPAGELLKFIESATHTV